MLIASTQIKDFFGLRVEHVPGDFLGRMEALAAHWNTLSPQATVMAAASLALMVLMMRFVKRVPGAIVTLFASTIAVAP